MMSTLLADGGQWRTEAPWPLACHPPSLPASQPGSQGCTPWAFVPPVRLPHPVPGAGRKRHVRSASLLS